MTHPHSHSTEPCLACRDLDGCHLSTGNKPPTKVARKVNWFALLWFFLWLYTGYMLYQARSAIAKQRELINILYATNEVAISNRDQMKTVIKMQQEVIEQLHPNARQSSITRQVLVKQ